MPHSLPASSPLARQETVLAGLGFAVGFGWLWFPALQGIWLPGFLWGGPWSGGGTSAFCALLLAGFAAIALWPSRSLKEENAENGETESRNLLSRNIVRRVQAASLLLALLSLLVPLPGRGFFHYLSALGMALVGILQGLFWGSLLLRLPPSGRNAGAGWAFALASALAALFSALLAFVPPHLLPFSLCISLGAAWYCAEKTVGLWDASSQAEPKRGRGRPRLVEESGKGVAPEQAVSPDMVPALWAAAFLFFFLGMEDGVAAGANSRAPWIAGTLSACGAILAAALCACARERQERLRVERSALRLFIRAALSPLVPLCAVLALLGIGRLALSASFSLPAALLEGMACVFTLKVLGGLPQTERSTDRKRRTALALLLALLLGNLGASAAQWLALWLGGMENAPSIIRPAGALALILAFILSALPLARRVRPRNLFSSRGIPQQAAARALEPESPAAPDFFTARELEILTLIREGRNNKDIANRLFVQEATVRFHLRNIYQKTGLTEREQLAGLDLPPIPEGGGE